MRCVRLIAFVESDGEVFGTLTRVNLNVSVVSLKIRIKTPCSMPLVRKNVLSAEGLQFDRNASVLDQKGL